jgi:hypothetical protein
VTSRRAGWDLAENRLSRALDARRAAGLPVLDWTESNPTRVGLPVPDAEIRRALSAPGVLVYDPAPRGLPSAREAVAAHHGVDPDRVILTASTSEAYAFVWKLVCDPGDEVLVPRPSYPLFDYLSELEGVVARGYRLDREEGWRVDRGSVASAIGPRTRAIAVVHPNNPTGSLLSADEIRALAAHGLPVVSDEVFADYAATRAPMVAAQDDFLAFTLSGLSKLALCPQVKLGWIVVGGPAAARADALARLEVISDTYLSVSASAQHAAPDLLRIGADLRGFLSARIAVNDVRLRERTAGGPIEVLGRQAGWYAVVRLPRTHGDEEWALRLLEAGLYVHPGSFFDFEEDGFVVVSLILPPEAFSEAVDVLVGTASE